MEFTPEFIENMKKINQRVDANHGKKVSNSISSGFNDSMAGGSMDSYLTEEQMMQMKPAQVSKPTYREGQDPYAYNPNKGSSKLPAALDAILAETAKKTGATLNQGSLAAVAASMAASAPAPQPIQEVVIPAAPVSIPNNSGIDYTILKAIIKECIDEKFKEFNKVNLNENNLKAITLKDGKIKLIDNSGNIYAAKLEKTGNINDKKK